MATMNIGRVGYVYRGVYRYYNTRTAIDGTSTRIGVSVSYTHLTLPTNREV